MRAISAYARSQGIDSRMRGTKIIIDSKTYAYSELKDLPHELTIAKAKTIEVEDGIAFQSKHSFLSNRYPCTIKSDDRVYNCSEQMFLYTRAIENNEGGVANLIMKESEPTEMSRLGRNIVGTKEWKENEVPTMAIINKKKFDQNPHLKDKLCKTKGNLYEATLHPIYGCGFTLAQNKSIKKTNVTAGNKLGDELVKLRDSYTANTN